MQKLSEIFEHMQMQITYRLPLVPQVPIKECNHILIYEKQRNYLKITMYKIDMNINWDCHSTLLNIVGTVSYSTLE